MTLVLGGKKATETFVSPSPASSEWAEQLLTKSMMCVLLWQSSQSQVTRLQRFCILRVIYAEFLESKSTGNLTPLKQLGWADFSIIRAVFFSPIIEQANMAVTLSLHLFPPFSRSFLKVMVLSGMALKYRAISSAFYMSCGSYFMMISGHTSCSHTTLAGRSADLASPWIFF